MKNHSNSIVFGILFFLILIVPNLSQAQKNKSLIKDHLTKIKIKSIDNSEQKYRMTAIYTNRDLYGNFIDKTKVTGKYTKGLESGNVKWNDVYTSVSKSYDGSFPSGIKQEYIENITYVPSPEMLDAGKYKDFPPTAEAVFSRNLIWDTMAIEGFAFDHLDKLELNKTYKIPSMAGEFNMADIGTYNHAEIQLRWTGISSIEHELYAIIEYEAIDNIISLSMEAIKTKGTEQYWGTILVSLETRAIANAVMYSGSMMEIEIAGMPNKLMIKTIRELWFEKI